MSFPNLDNVEQLKEDIMKLYLPDNIAENIKKDAKILSIVKENVASIEKMEHTIDEMKQDIEEMRNCIDDLRGELSKLD
jgi:septal ring factor EnvC (AmiA/AmiB activator)